VKASFMTKLAKF